MPDKDTAAESFGYVIAYLLPGFAGLWAAAYYSDAVKGWFGTAATQETTFGGFLFLLLAGLTVGMIVQLGRWIFFEEMLGNLGFLTRTKRFAYLKRPHFKDERRTDPAVQAAVREARDQHYRYYQFYGGLFVVLPVVFRSWQLFATEHRHEGWVTLGFVVTEVLLLAGTLDCLKRDRKKLTAILGVRS